MPSPDCPLPAIRLTAEAPSSCPRARSLTSIFLLPFPQQHAYRRGAAGARRDLIAAKKIGDGPTALTEEQKQEIR